MQLLACASSLIIIFSVDKWNHHHHHCCCCHCCFNALHSRLLRVRQQATRTRRRLCNRRPNRTGCTEDNPRAPAAQWYPRPSKFGNNAIGYNATSVSRRYGVKVQIREYFARVKVFIDLLLGVQPKFLGEKISIGLDSN